MIEVYVHYRDGINKCLNFSASSLGVHLTLQRISENVDLLSEPDQKLEHKLSSPQHSGAVSILACILCCKSYPDSQPIIFFFFLLLIPHGKILSVH